MVDTMRETRAMVLCALPYPPLPVECEKMLSDSMMTASELDVTTSHTLLAQCMNSAVLKNDMAANNARKARQIQVLQEFLHELVTVGFELRGEPLYQFYCKHALKHIGTYFDVSCPPDIRFKPYSYMTVGDKSHAKMVEYCLAQGILYQEKPDARRISRMDLAKLLVLIRSRVGETHPL